MKFSIFLLMIVLALLAVLVLVHGVGAVLGGMPGFEDVRYSPVMADGCYYVKDGRAAMVWPLCPR